MQKFPEGFLWGAATSAVQSEGGIQNNDWAALERAGKAPPIGVAADHYNRYEEDSDIAQSLNFNAFRFSIEWARVEPEEGMFDENEIAHYRKVVQALKVRGMEPIVNLWHFSLPEWFSQSGNFSRRDGPAIFARYATKIAEAFGDDVRWYLTINEPLVWLGEQGVTVRATSGIKNPIRYVSDLYALISAHKMAFTAIKRINPKAQVGIAKHNFSFVGLGFFGNVAASLARLLWNRHFLNAIREHQDFIGIQYYQRLFFWQSKKEDASAPKSDIGWQIHPEGIYDPLKEAARYGVPLIISESGIADATDQHREAFIKESLKGVHRAIEGGVPIVGYLHWSLLDNYEFLTGFTMRFGLVHVDFENNQKRTIRESAKAYAEICKNNAI
jgi:beta-glucosidase